MKNMIVRLVPVAAFMLALAISGGCHSREQPPPSAYDPALLKAAREVAAEREAADKDSVERSQPEQTKSECTRQEGGCKPGYICWDSYYCKLGFADQCSASGDKRCHKLCADDSDCPAKMPHCRVEPIFSGTERGVEEKFCVRKRR